MANKIALIAIDWGTTNRRAWALARNGRIIAERSDAEGLLSIPKDGFDASFARLTEHWRNGDETVPALMCGMVGSKLGWAEAPYVALPADFREFARRLCAVPGTSATWIVPGAWDNAGAEPDVMRGEECQILGALLANEIADAVFVLPGTHSKWAVVEGHRLVRFRTYMTGELFSMLRGTGTIAQLMVPGDDDFTAFEHGLARSVAEPSDLLHALFGVRTLALFDRMRRESLASYLSGLLIGAEFADALQWSGKERPIIAIGSPQLLAKYDSAARHFGVALEPLESGAVLPQALFRIAQNAGLTADSGDT
jgi:2-dehydro-3-deoxygalactonokinase